MCGLLFWSLEFLHYAGRHLVFESQNRTIYDQEAGAPQHTLLYVCFTLNGITVYKMNIMLCLRRPEAKDRDRELIRKRFNVAVNQVRSRVLFSYAYITSDFNVKPEPATISQALQAFFFIALRKRKEPPCNMSIQTHICKTLWEVNWRWPIKHVSNWAAGEIELLSERFSNLRSTTECQRRTPNDSSAQLWPRSP